METNRPPIVPPTDISDFYNALLKKNLDYISRCYDELPQNRKLIIDMNRTLNKTFKQIRHWLEEYGFKKEIYNYRRLNKRLDGLKPFINVPMQNDDSDERTTTSQMTKHYRLYHFLVEEKECLIWKCLGNLGILGRLKEGSEERVV